MKAILGFAVLAVASANAFAAEFDRTCEAECVPFGKANPAVLNVAVGLAQHSTTQVGDTLGVCHDLPNSAIFIFYTIISEPVTSSANISFQSTLTYPGDQCFEYMY
jgi:hypothetical protein